MLQSFAQASGQTVHAAALHQSIADEDSGGGGSIWFGAMVYSFLAQGRRALTAGSYSTGRR